MISFVWHEKGCMSGNVSPDLSSDLNNNDDSYGRSWYSWTAIMIMGHHHHDDVTQGYILCITLCDSYHYLSRSTFIIFLLSEPTTCLMIVIKIHLFQKREGYNDRNQWHDRNSANIILVLQNKLSEKLGVIHVIDSESSQRSEGT